MFGCVAAVYSYSYQTRGVLIWGILPDWQSYGIFLAVSLIIAGLGFAFFQKTRKGFADVL